ncbi:pleiotropic drug resistance protein, ABC superfamily, partial [Hortaea werneckii]
RSKGEVLVFRRGKNFDAHARGAQADEESGEKHASDASRGGADERSTVLVAKQSSIFHWEDVCYSVKIKDETRRILDHVDGWIKPGTLTALMGVSGAGKTTLLDVLASRTTVGVISRSMLVDGSERHSSFQRMTGYVQQQDLHVHTSTVREALEFSAVLRQSAEYTHEGKVQYVDKVIDLLGMQAYADAVVGTPGSGLNVEQRKRLTIGVELAARPKLLFFLDEPTSGLDSQTSWNICDLMRNLTQNGQAIFCTIHQPSAVLFQRQLLEVGKRVFQQYWRTPSYIFSKFILCIFNSLFIGFSFYMEGTSIQGLQNQMFGVFIFLFIIIILITQVLPIFVEQRTMYEARERQSRTYAWQAFVLSNVLVELFWNTVMAIFSYFVWYYPIGLYKNAQYTNTVHSRGFLTFLIFEVAYLFASSFGHMLIAGIEEEQIASSLATLMGIMMYAFCGVLSGPNALPGFWIFMYRVNPFTYLVSSLLSATLGDAPIECTESELQRFFSPKGQTCAEYLGPYLRANGGYIEDPSASDTCQYCRMRSTNDFLAGTGIEFSNRWRDWGIMCAYIVFNVGAALALYWLARVPKRSKKVAL